MVNITRRSLVPLPGILRHIFEATTSTALSGFFQLELEIVIGLLFIPSSVHPFRQGNWLRAASDTIFEQRLT
jgi:hypothetical protein